MIRECFGRTGLGGAMFGLMVVAMAVAPELTAQRWGGGNRGGIGLAGAGNLTVERVIRLADELELTAAQREELESVRVELLEARTGRAVSGMKMLSEIRAGIREPEAIRTAAGEAAREAREMLSGVRERLSGILTEDQREELRRLNRQVALRERGARDGRGGALLDRMRDRRGRVGIGRGRVGIGRGAIGWARALGMTGRANFAR